MSPARRDTLNETPKEPCSLDYESQTTFCPDIDCDRYLPSDLASCSPALKGGVRRSETGQLATDSWISANSAASWSVCCHLNASNSAILKCCCCRFIHVPQASSLSSTAFKRLTRELLQLQASPPEGIRVVLDEHDMLQVVGWIEG